MDIKLFIRRFLAFVIDWNIMLGPGWFLMFFGPGSNPEYLISPCIQMFTSVGFLLGLVWILLYGLLKDCLFGRSLGKMICGLTVQNAETGR